MPPLVLYLPPFLGGILWWLKASVPLGLIGISFPVFIAVLEKGALIRHILRAFAFSVLIFSLGLIHMKFYEGLLFSQNQALLRLSTKEKPIVLTGRVEKVPVPSLDGSRLKVWIPSMGRLILYCRNAPWYAFSPGDWIRFSARLRAIKNPGVEGVFDRESWWRSRSILVQGFTEYPLKCVRLGNPGGLWLEGLRMKLLGLLMDRLGSPEGGLAAAFLLGEKAWIPHETKEAFFRAGVGHILAVSGLHMAIVALFAGLLVRWILSVSTWILLKFPVRKVAVASGCAAALFYAALSGFSPSSQRAFIMVLSFGLALFLKRHQEPINALFLAAWLILAQDPFSAASPGFILSFSAVFFLIWFSPWIGRGKAPFNLLRLAIVAWAATLPVTTAFFHRVALLAIPVNWVLVPIIGTLVLPALFGLVVLDFMPSAFSFLLLPFWKLLRLSFLWMEKGVSLCSRLSFSSIHLWTPSLYLSFFFYLSLFSLGGILSYEKRVFKPLLALGAAGVFGAFLFQYVPLRFGGSQEFQVLDVGQGLSQLYLGPGARTVVIDAGGGEYPYDKGETVVAPHLFFLNRNVIDYLIISHYDKDHAGGAFGLVHELKVREVLGPHPVGRNNPVFKGLKGLLQKKGIAFKIIERPLILRLGTGTRLYIYPGNSCPGARGRNDLGLVCLLCSGERSILMPADIEKRRERCLIQRGMIGPVDVMVVPHHGSASSSSEAFLKAMEPEAAIFSYGEMNAFGFPSPGIRGRYQAVGARIYETPKDGTITISIKTNGDLVIHSYTGKDSEYVLKGYPATPKTGSTLY